MTAILQSTILNIKALGAHIFFYLIHYKFVAKLRDHKW